MTYEEPGIYPIYAKRLGCNHADFAPIEHYAKDAKGHTVRYRPANVQAVHCPACNALIAVGQSYHDHTFFCKGGSR